VPITREQALEIARRLTRGEPPETLVPRLAPTPESEREIPPGVPRSGGSSAADRDARLEYLRERGLDLPCLEGKAPSPDPESLSGNVENFIGMAQIPVGLVGPLRVNGLHAHGDYLVPLATTEGTLVASYHRGARLLTRAGGVSVLTTSEHVQRAPGFVFERIADAALFSAWASGEYERMCEVAAGVTAHGELTNLRVHLETRTAYLIFEYYTGDASGQNMVTFCTDAICRDLIERSPVKPRHWFIEANMSGDKKATAMSFLTGRGRKAVAEATLPRELVERGLHTTPERMAEYWRVSFIGGAQTGSIGVSGHVANGLAALFAATGQDIAAVSEAAVGITRMETTAAGDLWVGVDLPNLIVGTVGGGTRTPTARECLQIMECEGEGCANRFAEIAAALVLGGEISIVGAICAGEFAQAHQRHGRPPGR